MSNESASDMVEVELVDGNLGDHLIAFQGISYGYQVSGNRFPMRRDHAQLDRRVRIVTGNATVQAAAVAAPPPPPKAAAKAAPAQPQPAIQSRPVVDDDDDWADAPTTPTPTPAPAKASNAVMRDAPLMKSMAAQEEPAAPSEPVGTPGPQPDDLISLWGIDEERAAKLATMGIRTYNGLIMLGVEGLVKHLGLAELVSKRIISETKKAAGVKD